MKDTFINIYINIFEWNHRGHSKEWNELQESLLMELQNQKSQTKHSYLMPPNPSFCFLGHEFLLGSFLIPSLLYFESTKAHYLRSGLCRSVDLLS